VCAPAPHAALSFGRGLFLLPHKDSLQTKGRLFAQTILNALKRRGESF
jgi:hypothetical protein